MTQEEWKKLIEEHRTAGDLMEYCYSVRDKSQNDWNEVKGLLSKAELTEYLKNLDNHMKDLFDSYTEKGTVDKWLNDLKKNDLNRYKNVARVCLREFYAKEIAEHRSKGDLIDYIWELNDELKLWHRPFSAEYDYDVEEFKENYPLEYYVLRPLLRETEREELRQLFDVVHVFGESYESLLANTCRDEFKYIFKLYKSPLNSAEHGRYEKIRDRVKDPNVLVKLDASIKKVEEAEKKRKFKKFLLLKILPLVVVGVALVITAVIVIHNIATKDARLAKKEQQRIEKQQKIDAKNLKKEQQRIAEQEAIDALNDAKNLKKAQSDDVKLLESLGNVKLSQQDLLISTSEPVMYVLAPMTYDTTKFVADASRESGSFGKTVDNSKERLMLLEICITDFESKIDAKTGVSFLDRSKIAQIENEHEFQLGDWSNNKKTAEIGKALNSNVLLFLDKFGYIDSSYHFEAKFVDINTMKSSVYSVVYKNPKSKVKTPEIVDSINFKDFTAVSTKKNPFDDEITLSAAGTVRTSQRLEYKNVCPFGSVAKLDFSEYDVNSPNDEILKAKELYFDGFGRLEITSDEGTENLTYSFEPVEMNLIRDGDNYYTDGKIGTLVLKDGASYKNYDVFTQNGREYFVRLGSENLDKVQVNYFVRFSKE